MKHLIFIGFKNVGKTCVARAAAQELNLPFVDSDRKIEEKFAAQNGADLSCREIMKQHGSDVFRFLEKQVLAEILKSPEKIVLSVGGGAPLAPANQVLLKEHEVVLVTAHKGCVYERIMLNGLPAFFPPAADPYQSFQQIWNERRPIYEQLAKFTVDNSGTVDETVQQLLKIIS